MDIAASTKAVELDLHCPEGGDGLNNNIQENDKQSLIVREYPANNARENARLNEWFYMKIVLPRCRYFQWSSGKHGKTTIVTCTKRRGCYVALGCMKPVKRHDMTDFAVIDACIYLFFILKFPHIHISQEYTYNTV